MLNISEYWIVDPQEEKVTIFTLAILPDEGFQEPEVFSGEMQLRSTTFPNLELTPSQLFN